MNGLRQTTHFENDRITKHELYATAVITQQKARFTKHLHINRVSHL